MKTSTAEANGWTCPRCGDDTTQDPSGKGFVRHTTIPGCPFERGRRDAADATRPLTEDERALAEVNDWGPAEDWSDWDDAAG